MRIGKPVNGAMIEQSGPHRSRQGSLVDSTRKVTKQVAYRRFDGRLRQHQVCEMVHSGNTAMFQQPVTEFVLVIRQAAAIGFQVIGFGNFQFDIEQAHQVTAGKQGIGNE